MKRTALKRKTPMARKSMRRRPRSTSYARRERDFDYMMWVKSLECLAQSMGPCDGVTEADHVGARAASHKSADDETIPLCTRHHAMRTAFTGVFKRFDRSAMREWVATALLVTQEAFRKRQHQG